MNEQQHTPDLGAVLGGLVLVAVAAAVVLHEVSGRSLDWKVYAAGVLLLGGLAVVTSSAVGALARHHGRRDQADRPR